MSIEIIGSGMAGMLAARMLQNYDPVIYEAAPALPNNHSAVLRFRTSQVGDVLSVPFKKVKVAKGYVPWRNPIADSMAYSRKTNGTSRSDRSIISTDHSLNDRFIAPPNLIELMSKRINIEFNKSFNNSDRKGPVISTIPMPMLMKILDYKYAPQFGAVNGANIRATLSETDAYFSLYVPDPSLDFNRISITGNELIIEFSFPKSTNNEVRAKVEDWQSHNDKITELTHQAIRLLGLEDGEGFPEGLFRNWPTVKAQQYSKILPIDEDIRRDFLHWATDKHDIYSLGRFATWRPGVLLDDLVKDVRLIEGFINSKNRYGISRHRAGGEG